MTTIHLSNAAFTANGTVTTDATQDWVRSPSRKPPESVAVHVLATQPGDVEVFLQNPRTGLYVAVNVGTAGDTTTGVIANEIGVITLSYPVAFARFGFTNTNSTAGTVDIWTVEG